MFGTILNSNFCSVLGNKFAMEGMWLAQDTYTVWTLENANFQWNKLNVTFSKMMHNIFTNWEKIILFSYIL